MTSLLQVCIACALFVDINGQGLFNNGFFDQGFGRFGQNRFGVRNSIFGNNFGGFGFGAGLERQGGNFINSNRFFGQNFDNSFQASDGVDLRFSRQNSRGARFRGGINFGDQQGAGAQFGEQRQLGNQGFAGQTVGAENAGFGNIFNGEQGRAGGGIGQGAFFRRR